MKKLMVGLIMVASVCCLVLGLPGQGAAQQYLGETTWTVTKTKNQNGSITPKSATLTAGITRMGGQFYTMTGSIDASPNGYVILSGGGVLIGNTIYLTLTTSQQRADAERDTSVLHAELDAATLNGSFYDVELDFDTSTFGLNPVFPSKYSEGSVTRTGPFIKLHPQITGLQLLLEDNVKK
jgi:hypothetical protein